MAPTARIRRLFIERMAPSQPGKRLESRSVVILAADSIAGEPPCRRA
jgi:hypothetical protein